MDGLAVKAKRGRIGLPMGRKKVPWWLSPWAIVGIPLGAFCLLGVLVACFDSSFGYSQDQRIAVRWLDECMADSHYKVIDWTRSWNSEGEWSLSATIRYTTPEGGPGIMVRRFHFNKQGRLTYTNSVP